MRVVIISDNTVCRNDLKKEWGFAALVEAEDNTRMLFDTGSNGSSLLHNMKKLNIDPKAINCVFISHDHWDHTGGLKSFLKLNDGIELYLPDSFSPFSAPKATRIIRAKDSLKIRENVFSTGELLGLEQSMAVKTGKGVVVVAGCSHPGVGNILDSAKQYGELYGLIGGLHGFNDFDLLGPLNLVCATHCTQHKDQIEHLYPQKCVEGGAGTEIDI